MVTVVLLIVAVLLLLYAAYERIPRSFRLELNVRPPRGKPHVFTTKLPPALRRPGNEPRLQQPVRDARVPASGDARSPAASADRGIGVAHSIPADLPTRTIRVRPARRTSALWFGLLALGLALVGQHNLSPASGPPSDAAVG